MRSFFVFGRLLYVVQNCDSENVFIESTATLKTFSQMFPRQKNGNAPTTAVLAHPCAH